MSSNVGERDDADQITLSASDALTFGERALQRIGFSADEARIIAAHLIDAELCGYPAIGLARILTYAEHPRMREPRRAPAIVHETAVSALVDGGNNPGTYAVYRTVQIALDKARANRYAVVGAHNAYLSGRNAYYLELIARAGFVGMHFACGAPLVAPLGGSTVALGTNPLAFSLPGEPDPLIFDMATSALNHGDLKLASRLGALLPDGMAVDAQGLPTRDPEAALAGAILPFGGHKGFGLSLMVQALGLLAGAAFPRGRVQDFGFLFVVFDPSLLIPAEQFKRQLAELLARVKQTPRQPGIAEIRIPSERAFRERERRRREGIQLPRRIYDRIQVL